MRKVRRALVTCVLGCWMVVLTPSATTAQEPRPTAGDTIPQADQQQAVPVFRDVATELGIEFVHVSGKVGELYYHEIMGAGCALLDYDNDGDLDAYLVQGHPIGKGFTYRRYHFPAATPDKYRDRLFANQLETTAGGSHELSFVDVTEAAGITASGYGIGVTTGDVNNDGLTDLFVTNYGPNELWLNQGGGKFVDATQRAGLSAALFSVSATLFDYDHDGWLDLYVTNYIDYTYSQHTVCRHGSGAPDYCSPSAYQHLADQLYHNQGDGTFTDVSAQMGIAKVRRSGLGVVAVDVDDDTWPDVYVGDDLAENLLWMNQAGKAFTDEGVFRGCALSGEGLTEASMGVAAADYDGDGDQDLFASHMNKQTNTLYRNLGQGLFEDAAAASGMGQPTWRHTTYAGVWLDYDNDGWLDLLAVNGGMLLFNDIASPDDPNPLADPNQLFHNQGNGTFVEVSSAAAGPDVGLLESGRGVAVGDVDNDGDPDVLLSNNDGPARLLLNQVGAARNWLGLSLLNVKRGRHQLGAIVEVVRPKAPPLVRRVAVDGSYGSAHDPRVLVGLGDDPAVSLLRVRWPDGTSEEFKAPQANAYTTLIKGSGKPTRQQQTR